MHFGTTRVPQNKMRQNREVFVLQGDSHLNKLNVALDGPAGAGKSTIARLLAKELGYIYIDTGAMYRAVTWKMLELGLEPSQHEEIVEMATKMDIRLIPGSETQQVWVNDIDVTNKIRTNTVNSNVPLVAQIPRIRELMVHLQQEMAKQKGIVMDGRDIGTQVLPDAEVKIFLTASIQERARRRLYDTQSEGHSLTIEEMERELERRDQLDEQREVSPLIQAEDAIVLDSTGKGIDVVVKEILELCIQKGSGGREG